jgi:hypothetical protein
MKEKFERRINVEKEKVERKRQFQETLQKRYKMSMVGKEKVLRERVT